MPHFALESTALGPTICGKEEGYDRLNVCVPLPKKISYSYVDMLTPSVVVFEEGAFGK